jgi:hypothetical protein
MFDTLDPGKLQRDWLERDQMAKTTGFVRPDDRLLRFLAAHGPYTEIGAGTGYLTRGINAIGGVSVATDDFS